jgi:hypothetical protein
MVVEITITLQLFLLPAMGHQNNQSGLKMIKHLYIIVFDKKGCIPYCDHDWQNLKNDIIYI